MSMKVFTGPMFSGKTSAMIQEISKLSYTKKNVRIYKPRIDTRVQEEEVKAHNGMRFKAKWVDTPYILHNDVLDNDIQIVGVDEAQFFDKDLANLLYDLSKTREVLVAGLDTAFNLEPFYTMSNIMAYADEVIKLHAICSQCHGIATQSQRVTDNDKLVVVGGHEQYEPRCRKCHEI